MSKSQFARIFAVRLAEARGVARLTQEAVAHQLGMAQSAYSKYENRGGDKPPSLMPHTLLVKFCEITGADLKTLLRDPR